MDIPEPLRRMVDELGDALAAALVGDPRCRELALEIQKEGFGLALSIEAAVVGRFDDGSPSEAVWSEEDKAFLKTFRIALE